MVKFKDDDALGKTVKSTRIYCSIGVEPIKTIDQLRYAAGGHKFSSLCGFMFDSANEAQQFPRFMISFVCKLRSKIYRQAHTNPSKWFIFKRINNSRVDVLDKKALLVNYGFDIDKFFQSDIFKSCLPKFEKTLQKGLEDIKAFMDTPEGKKNKSEVERFVRAINESMPLMLNTTILNDKYYKLTDLTAIDKELRAAVSDEVKKKTLDAKMAAIRKGNKRFMDQVAANQRNVEPTAAEESEDTEVDEASNPADYKCKVEKKTEGGEDVWEVVEIATKSWVATFHDEQAANAFAEQYPALRAKYIDTATEDEEGDEDAKQKADECDAKEKQLDADIEESLKEIYK